MSKLLRLLVSASLLTLLATRLDWGPTAAAFRGLDVRWWLAALGLFVGVCLLGSYRWLLLARPFGFRHGPGRFAGITFLGMFFNLLLPTSVGGDVVRAWYLDGGSGRRMAALLCVVFDRATGLLVLLGIACCASLVQFGSLPAWVLAAVWGAAAAVVSGLCVLPWLARLANRFAPVAPETPAPPGRLGRLFGVVRKLATVPLGLLNSVKLFRGRPGLVGGTLLLSLLIQGGNVVVVWMLAAALGVAVPPGFLFVAVPVVSLLTLLPVSVNGMGVREVGMGLVLAEAGVPVSVGVTISVLWFGVLAAASLAGAGVYLFGRFPAPPAEEPAPAEAEVLPTLKVVPNALAVDRDPPQRRAG